MGGTLMISRAVKNHEFYKKRLETLGFPNVTLTGLEKDALNSLIYSMKPDRVMIGARFYQCATPYMLGQLKKNFPKINFAALSIGEYPAELAMYFILNGAKEYVTSFDGIDEWYKGLEDVRCGHEYIAPMVQERIDLRKYYPMPAKTMSERHSEVIRLICNGWQDEEIANILHISRRTVTTHKTEIFRSLNVRSPLELLGIALNLELIHPEDIQFRPETFEVTPLPENRIKKRGKEW